MGSNYGVASGLCSAIVEKEHSSSKRNNQNDNRPAISDSRIASDFRTNFRQRLFSSNFYNAFEKPSLWIES